MRLGVRVKRVCELFILKREETTFFEKVQHLFWKVSYVFHHPYNFFFRAGEPAHTINSGFRGCKSAPVLHVGVKSAQV